MTHRSSPPVVCFVGRSGSGKTTLLEKLIPQLKQKGYRLATIKHHSHPGIDIDKPGKDTWRHAQAGSDHVVIAAPDQIATIQKLDAPRSLDEIAAGITGVDLILTEGYKRSNRPKVEIVRSARGTDPICTADELLALVTDVDIAIDVPQFGLDDAAALADFLEYHFLKSA